jgi:hypothetical protein
MSGLMSFFFGPLDKSACIYFFLISAVFLMSFLLLLGSEIIYLLTNSGKLNIRIVATGVMMLFNAFLAYFVNRLLYTICSKSLA